LNNSSGSTAARAYKELGWLAGVEVTPHRLHHTFCKMLVDAGESLDRVAVLAGHANLNTTARHTWPGVKDLERAVDHQRRLPPQGRLGGGGEGREGVLRLGLRPAHGDQEAGGRSRR